MHQPPHTSLGTFGKSSPSWNENPPMVNQAASYGARLSSYGENHLPVISAMALDYPPDKLSVYLSNDGESFVTLRAMKEAWRKRRSKSKPKRFPKPKLFPSQPLLQSPR